MKMKYFLLIIFAALPYASIHAEVKSRKELREEESKAIREKSLRIATQFYSLEEGEEIKEITQNILESSDTKDLIKQRIIDSGRRFFLFTYPSDGFKVKGYLSFVTNSSLNPLLILLRGGNREFGLMHPASDFTCSRNYTVIATAYRGGVSEGTDQFGGDDVNDVPNLMEYFPILTQKLGLEFHPHKVFMLGGSRGGMEMFLALGRSPFLQSLVTKAASLSGLLDIRECMRDSEGLRKMFITDFGLIPGKNEEAWIAERNPIDVIPKLKKDLPLLIIQGTDDLRGSLNEGYHMVEKLKENGNCVDYLEVPGATHCLSNQPNPMDLIADWFELDTAL